MATILNDTELKKLIGSVIINGDTGSIRPNSYILHLGGQGEFLNAGKEFTIGSSGKKGIKIPPGHLVAVTALETIDFRSDTIAKIYPNSALHGFISPTTDLSREGIVAPTTQIDAGYYGTLNWTITNSSNQERRFTYGEKIYRLTILKLDAGEVPLKFYDGDYQSQTGYVRSQRRGAPVGMKDHEWVDSNVEGGPEEQLESLIKSGYPWHLLGQRLKQVDQQMKIVSDEYADIHDTLENINRDVDKLTKQDHSDFISKAVSSALDEQTTSLQNRWLIATALMLFGAAGLLISIVSSDAARGFLKDNGSWIGVLVIVFGVVGLIIMNRRKKLN